MDSMWQTVETTESPAAYAETAVLTIEQVAGALQVSVRSVERMKPPIPCVYIGRLRRFVWKQVLDTLMSRAA